MEKEFLPMKFPIKKVYYCLIVLYFIQLIAFVFILTVPFKSVGTTGNAQIRIFKNDFSGFGAMPLIGWATILYPEGYILEVEYNGIKQRSESFDLISDIDLDNINVSSDNTYRVFEFGLVDRISFVFE